MSALRRLLGSHWLHAGAALALLALLTLGYRLTQLGAFSSAGPELSSALRLVPGLRGPEDCVLDGDSGRCFVSCGGLLEDGSRGGIYGLDLEDAAAPPVLLSIDGPDDFHPHGIDLHRGADGVMLFAVNHRGDGGQTIERFALVDDGGLRHVETLTSPMLTAPNDVAATGARSCYVTCTGASRSGLQRSADVLLGRASGGVLHFDGERWRSAAAGLAFPNGIALSGDGTALYVSETIGGTLAVFDRAGDAGDLILRRRVALGTGADNISVDRDGVLWIPRHSDLLALAAHRREPSRASPWRLLRVAFSADEVEVSEALSGSGGRCSGISSATHYHDRLLLGSVAGDGLLVCTW